MNRSHPSLRQRAGTALATLISLAALAALGGCGPGTGGSGDGEHARGLQAFGANAAPVCGSPIAAVLACSSANANAPDNIVEGTQMVLFSDTQAGNNVAVAISGNQLELSARCQNVRFAGEWGITAPNDARFFGTYTAPGQLVPAPASLTVQTATPSTTTGEVFALLRGLDGRVLLGPVLLQRVPSRITNPALCPS